MTSPSYTAVLDSARPGPLRAEQTVGHPPTSVCPGLKL